MFFILFNVLVTVECCRYGEIVLVGGITQYEGRVDVCLDGRWNTICRDACWGPPDSRVICRQLGFLEIDLRRQNEYSNQYMGHLPGSGQILSNVECQTTERRLIECNYKYPSTNCTHKMDAGVQCMDGGTPTGLMYNIHNNSVSLSWNSSISEYETLRDYSATCFGWVELEGELMSQHTVQFLVSNVTTSVILEGLNFNALFYNCCVAANYKTYSPRTCVFINSTKVDNTPENGVHTSEVYTETNTTASSLDNHGTTTKNDNEKMTAQCTIQTLADPSSCSETLITVGSIMGVLLLIFVMISFISWTCTCLIYRKTKLITANQLQNRTLQESTFDNPTYTKSEGSSRKIEDVHGQGSINHITPRVNQTEAQYEMVDLEPQAVRNSMIKSRYEFSELPVTENEKSSAILNEHYEFCEVQPEIVDVVEDPPEPEVYISTENLLNDGDDKKSFASTSVVCLHDGYENLKIIGKGNTRYKKTRANPPITLPSFKMESKSESEGDYSVTHVVDTDFNGTYSHTTARPTTKDDHKYSHTLILPDNKVSPGYLHLNTINPHQLFPSEENTSVRNTDGGSVIMKGYSHLNVSEVTGTLAGNAELAVTSNAYHTLDITTMTSEPNENATTSQTKSSTKRSLFVNRSKSSYSSLNVNKVLDNSPLQYTDSGNYSHLHIDSEEKAST